MLYDLLCFQMGSTYNNLPGGGGVGGEGWGCGGGDH